MTVWYSLPTIFNRRHALRIAGFLALCVALITTLLFSTISHALPNVTRTLTFQGRLLTSSGSVVADGHYNMQFKIYQDGSGTAAGNPDGTLKWTETYVNNGGTDGVEVKNGFFSVALGSNTPFGTSVDWNQNALWLSMNIAGNTAACSTFGTSPCVADGEMLPMKRITATPFALNSGAVGGKTADDLVQLGQGVQTDASNNSSIFVNKTGTGNLVQLQAGGTDAFTLNNAGSITLGSSANQSLSVATAASGAGKSLTISAGTAASGSNQIGGDVVLQGGAGNGTGDSGNVIVKANGTDSTGTFQVQNAAGDTLFNVDTSSSTVSVGTINLSTGGSGGSGDTMSLWNEEPVTATSYNDATPLNFGVTFRSDVDGYVKGVKFFNPQFGNGTGNDVGKLWACNSADCFLGSGGTELASVNFPMDMSEGWQTANFSTPVHISPGTFYVVSYYATAGRYKASPGYFTNDYHNAPLHALKTSTTQNGSFNPSSAGFPTNTFGAANYWVDVVFQASGSTDQISSGGDFIITSGGAMTIGPTSNSLALQGNAINIAATNGGNVSIQGGNATVSNGNGGTLTLSGGAGNGTGVSGLVVMNTPTFSTVTNDANCYAGGAVVASSCTITASTVNNNAAAIIGFSATGQTATLPDPTITTAGRILYVTAAGASETFTLKANTGGDAEQNVTMRRNTTATLLWNGNDWTVAGGSSSTTLQDAYTNTPQDAAGSDVVVSNNGANTGGLTIRDSSTNPVNGSLLDVKNAISDSLFSVNSKVTDGTEHASDGGVHTGASLSTNWPAVGSATVTRITSDGQEGGDSAQVAAGTSANNGVRNKLSINPQLSTKYQVSVYAKLTSGSAFTDFKVRYSPDGGSSFVDCASYNTQTVTTSGWSQITCEITTSATTVTDPYVYLVQPTAPGSARTYLVDTLSFTLASNNTPNVKVGSGSGTGSITLFTLDKSASAPAADDNDSLLGSMYYDTTLGKVQCYESEGWGQCGASPDIFVTISPEYTNAVMNGTDIGTITSDLCSDSLNINDGSSSQPTICGTNETYNFYKWTSAESTTQTRSIYVTYQLPSTFKQFAAGLTSLKGRTNSADSSVNYQVYRDHGSSGLTACGSAVSVSTGSQSSWQQATASGSADPSTCGFEAGDSILFRINLTAKSNANAYVSNLSFVFNNS